MKLWNSIICPACGSFRVAIRPPAPPTLGARILKWFEVTSRIPDRQVGAYDCAACGGAFTVEDPAAHARRHRPDVEHRCHQCDERAMARVEANHRYSPHQSPGEVADLYACSRCGTRVVLLVKEDPVTFYD